MDLNRNAQVAASFAARVYDYDAHASLQADIAAELGEMMPRLEHPKVLEVGCGTGLLTRHLLDRYPHGDFLITDIAPEMVSACKSKYSGANGRALRFEVLNGEAPDMDEHFDLIALSMTLQWFCDPLKGLSTLTGLLKPGGMLYYTTLAPGCFPEWREALDKSGLPHGLIEMPDLPGVTNVETRIIEYADGAAFLKTLKSIGAGVPRPGYSPIGPGALRSALRLLERKHGSRVTWRIAYGEISA